MTSKAGHTAAPATLRGVRALAKQLDATVEDDKIGDTHECRVCAPQGKIWCVGVHELIDSSYIPWKPDYADIIARMTYGIEDCTDPECDWCNSEGGAS